MILTFKIKHFFNLFLGACMLGSLAIPAQAATYLDVKLMEAVDQGQIAVVDSYLEKGADVNAQHGPKRETPLMKAIHAMATWTYRTESGGLFMLGLAALSHKSLIKIVYREDDVLSTGTSKAVYLLGWITLGSVVISLLNLDLQGKNRFEIIKILLKDPALNITLTNHENKTALEIVGSYLASLSEKRFKDELKIKKLEEIEKLLIAKESEAKNEEQHEQAA